ncbi:MAG TPA: hypothetical protein VJ385_01550 [Fibrobacteria bacterium]|nr:hypothetical protein [Fibrobacteria bacterium]
MKTLNLSIVFLVLALSLTKVMASSVWIPSPLTVQAVFTDDCGGSSGSSVTAFSLSSDSKQYYFLDSAPSAKQWLSEIMLALSTGLRVQIKYESQNSSPGSSCGFNPGYLVHVISISP